MVMRSVEADVELENGMNATRLGELFDLDRKTVQALLKECPPDGERNGGPFWHIARAAPYLVTPAGGMEDYLRKLKPKDLPATLQKEFWTALNLRAKYYTNRGDLWATSQVFKVVTDILKIVRETSRLFVDTLEGHTTITTEQREALSVEMDKMMHMMKESIEDSFKDYDPTKDHGEELEIKNVSQQLEHGGRSSEDRNGASEEPESNSWLDDI